MHKLLKRLKNASREEVLATADVWATRIMLTAALLLVIGGSVQVPTEANNLQSGLDAQSQQEYWRAEAFFQQAALLSPNDFQPSLDLGRLHLLEHRDALAQSELETARSLGGNTADIWLTLGDIAQDQGSQPAAEHAWLQATSLQPADAAMQAHERLGLLYAGQGHWQTAEAQFTALPASDTLAQYYLGVLRLARGDRADARQAFQAMLNQTTDAAQHTAAQQFLQALNQWDGSAQSEKLLGFTDIQNNFPTLALAPLQQAIALAPKDPDAHAYLGWASYQTGAISQAQQQETQALALKPADSFARYVLCLVDLANGHYSLAITDIEQAIAIDPQNPILWATRGDIADQLNDLPTAEQALRQAAADAGGDPQFSLRLAIFYADHQLGLNQGTALQAAQTATALAPTNALAFDTLGRIQQALNNLPAAMQAFIQAVNLAPTNASFCEHLGDIQATLGYIRSAELNLRKATVLDFDGPIAQQAQDVLQHLPPLNL